MVDSSTIPGWDSPEARELLERHNPVQVIFPNDLPNLSRPGTPSILRNQRWGDYHSCSAEDFLAQVVQLPSPRPFRLGDLLTEGHGILRVISNLLGQTKEIDHPTGLPELRARMATTATEAMNAWELDLAAIPSQDAQGAWKAYLAIIGKNPQAPVVYGRVVRTSDGTALQYWYLYLYNDFKNKHEGDWEMVTVALDETLSPSGVAVSAHHGGSFRPWSEVQRAGDAGLRPVVYVAKGSHANYFHHERGGYELIAAEFKERMHPPKYLGWLSKLIVWATKGLHWRDSPPADPETVNDDVPAREIGIRLSPTVRPMPDPADVDALPPEWWWLKYRGIWGSRHTRVLDTVGPDSPWHAIDGTKWADPAMWVRQIIALQQNLR